jgi:hypothetical protein
MISRDFVIWLKGFTEACNDFTATPKQWDRIKEVLDNVEDYDDNPGIIDAEIDHYGDWYINPKDIIPSSGSISASSANYATTGENSTSMVWNDKMGAWHHTNYPEGFGYYTNSTAEGKKEKQQLND